MKWLIKIKLIWLFFYISFLNYGCTQNNNSSKKIFSYNETAGIATLDPAFAKNQSIMWAVHQLYNTLVEVDSNLQIVPSLAKSWSISEDKRTYTFYLRNNIFFHDNQAFKNGKGRKMNANDIVYSFQRIINKKTASSGAWIFNNKVDTIEPYKAINDTTFQLKLLQPFHPILGILSMQYCSIVPKEVVEKFGKDFRNNPCGTGPFKFFMWQEGQALVLHKNESYWEKDLDGTPLPKIDAIKVSFFDNKATEFLQFRQGKLSFINDIDASFKDEVLTKNGLLRKNWQNKIKLNKHAYLNTEYLGILMDENNELVKSSPLKIKAIRKAINYAINKEQLMLYMRNSIGFAANNGFIPYGLPANKLQDKFFEYNPQKAKKILDSIQYNYTTIPITLLTIPVYADVASFITKQCELVGIKMQVEVIQKSLLLEQTAKSKAMFFRGSWIADYPDEENYFAVFYSKNPAPPNYTRFNNKTYDKLYEQALQETNDSARLNLYKALDNIIKEELPIIPIWYDMIIHLVNNNVQNFTPNSLNLLELRRVVIE
ncbi:MAG TPA: ABC transporter substrate-binding protein [Chitinophagaceae bacterium]|nr:ABC transporter substrate-binding protein [Chitinophagaceae bacterium]HMZ45823.1 ABC transporter substrate-binding protein [Chitinophagaceae bacterium]HNF30130.1 ABC transporter substrate-binding protein [Chitinophagaceae bacterium]HNM33847.1 ABC transporter substrate-binding protein [Chitinophagaceae bacterium]